jgi:hypothetical protein
MCGLAYVARRHAEHVNSLLSPALSSKGGEGEAARGRLIVPIQIVGGLSLSARRGEG